MSTSSQQDMMNELFEKFMVAIKDQPDQKVRLDTTGFEYYPPYLCVFGDNLVMGPGILVRKTSKQPIFYKYDFENVDETVKFLVQTPIKGRCLINLEDLKEEEKTQDQTQNDVPINVNDVPTPNDEFGGLKPDEGSYNLFNFLEDMVPKSLFEAHDVDDICYLHYNNKHLLQITLSGVFEEDIADKKCHEFFKELMASNFQDEDDQVDDLVQRVETLTIDGVSQVDTTQ